MKGRFGEIIKKNLISIICGVIALAAVGVAFTMLAKEKETLQKELDARKTVHTQLAGLLNSNRTLPTVSLEPGAQPEKLAKFPSQKIIDQGDAMVKELEKASKEILKAAIEMNRHRELEPGSLTAPNQAAAFRFRVAYERYFPVPPATVLQSQFAQDLKAGTPPTPEEVKLKVDQKAQDIKAKGLIVQGAFSNQAQVDQQIQQMARELPGQMRKEVAENSRVYINPLTFQPYPNIIGAAAAPAEKDIFGAQVLLWMQQDVVNAVNYANKDAKNVKDSTVKHLVRVMALPQGFPVPIGIGTGETPPGADPDAEVAKKPHVSPTARACNGMYDVYHLLVDADVDAAKVPDFLRSFGHKQFMTPLWADVKVIDLATERAAGHDYGDKPVVNVKVTCEVLYLRAWERPLIPKELRTMFGLPETDAAQPADAAPAAATPAPAGASGGAP